MEFTEEDLKQIEQKGISLEKIRTQIDTIIQGTPFVNLKSAATIGNGILKPGKADKNHYIKYFEDRRDELDIIKFVPASGQATRMFKFLFEFLERYDPEKESINSYINKNDLPEMSIFLVGLDKFPFYNEVRSYCYENVDGFANLNSSDKHLEYIRSMLLANRLNMSQLPKGLIPFHKYKDHTASAFEEHLFEAALYAASNGNAKLHFTISRAHDKKFDQEYDRIEKIVEAKTNTSFDIEFSFQQDSTDTISLDKKDQLFRTESGKLLFRPSGHGALLNNLNKLEADIVFIKNIDNVVVFKYEEEVAEYKKMIGGILLETQQQIFEHLTKLEDEDPDEAELVSIAEYLHNKLNVPVNREFEKYSKPYQVEYLRSKLNRPIRVCGMVKNEGEPGGGPFWVKSENGIVSLQIVESAQVDKSNPAQAEIFKDATHFNPVDLVCSLKNYKGEIFDLSKHVDHKQAFVSQKTHQGKKLKALELPGLWNGSMSDWNTVFVEVPLITFSPVKTVNDLLKPPHQIE